MRFRNCSGQKTSLQGPQRSLAGPLASRSGLGKTHVHNFLLPQKGCTGKSPPATLIQQSVLTINTSEMRKKGDGGELRGLTHRNEARLTRRNEARPASKPRYVRVGRGCSWMGATELTKRLSLERSLPGSSPCLCDRPQTRIRKFMESSGSLPEPSCAHTGPADGV